MGKTINRIRWLVYSLPTTK